MRCDSVKLNAEIGGEKMESKQVNLINRSDIVNAIQLELDKRYTKAQINEILNVFWDCCVYYLSNTTMNEYTVIKPFKGLQLTAKLEERKSIKALGTEWQRSARLWARAKLTRHFNRVNMNGFKR